MSKPQLVVGFTGWMDGGDVSTGVLEYLIERSGAEVCASILPDDFYIYNFPGSMEVASLFRPQTEIEDGIVMRYDEPENKFYADRKNNLLYFSGKEPNFRWRDFADCMFKMVSDYDVSAIYFVGSVAGLVPHTRTPRFRGSISREKMRPLLQRHNIAPSSYDGPASFVTYLAVCAAEQQVDMLTLVAEIPAYVDGRNVKCIKSAVQKLSHIIGLDINLDDLAELSEAFEQGVTESIDKRPELRDQIKKIEEHYDQELIGDQEEDLKAWFDKQGFRLE